MEKRLNLQRETKPKCNYRKGSRVDIVYQNYFEDNKTISAIAQLMNLSENRIKGLITYINNYELLISTSSTTSISDNNKKSIIIKVFEKDGDVILYIKTCKEFEDYLIKNHKVRESQNLWNQEITGKFYHLKIVDGYSDDINSSIIKNGTINFGILRVPKISEGIEYNLDGLLTQNQLALSVKKLIRVFNSFYKSKILLNKIDIEAEVQIENEN